MRLAGYIMSLGGGKKYCPFLNTGPIHFLEKSISSFGILALLRTKGSILGDYLRGERNVEIVSETLKER